MNLFYNNRLKVWFHSTLGKQVLFGHNKTPLPFIEKIQAKKDIFLFQVNCSGNNAGPLIGFLVHQNQKSQIMVNEPYVTGLAEYLWQTKCIPVLVPVEQIGNDSIDGAIFDGKNKRWIRGHFPVPNIFYNRISKRIIEKTPKYKTALSWIKDQQIPIFNPGFLDKYETFLVLRKNDRLRNFLPKTMLIRDKSSFLAFCQQHQVVYIKPRDNYKGNGVSIVKYHDSGAVVVLKYTEKQVFQCFDEYWEMNKTDLTNGTLIAQQAIRPATINGKRFDYRVLAHLKVEKNIQKYVLTGIGIRLAASHNITTHIPRGGKILKPTALILSDDHKFEIKQMINEIGHELTKHFGLFGEFSVDIGITKNNNLKIFEVNAKPMQFDERKIEKKRYERLRHLFLKLTDFA